MFRADTRTFGKAVAHIAQWQRSSDPVIALVRDLFLIRIHFKRQKSRNHSKI